DWSSDVCSSDLPLLSDLPEFRTKSDTKMASVPSGGSAGRGLPPVRSGYGGGGGTTGRAGGESGQRPAGSSAECPSEVSPATCLLHRGASSLFTAATPAMVWSRSGVCGMRLNAVQPAAAYGARNSATSSAVPYGQYFSKRSNGSW